MEEKLLYSERKALLENRGHPLVTAEVPWQVINAVAHNVHTQPVSYSVFSKFTTALTSRCAVAFGFWDFSNRDGTINFAKQLSLDLFLDFCEILAEEAPKTRYYNIGTSVKSGVWWARVEADLNAMFSRQRFGYRLENSLIRQLSSPTLDEAIVHPALFSFAKPGWEQAEASFTAAIRHRRGGDHELDDSLTAAASSVEAALKAAGYKGAKLSQLLRDYNNKEIRGGATRSLPTDLSKLLEQVMATRHSQGDAHGKEPDAAKVDPATVDLLIHWAGAFIVYLHDKQHSPDVQPDNAGYINGQKP